MKNVVIRLHGTEPPITLQCDTAVEENDHLVLRAGPVVVAKYQRSQCRGWHFVENEAEGKPSVA